LKAIVTGYSSGIGYDISNTLSEMGYEVVRLESRLENLKHLEIEVKDILKKSDIDILVNCAGLGVFEPHEEISVSKIKKIMDVNLTAPIVLSKLCLRSLKKTKGHIINISSIEALKHSRFSALYTASKSGLRDFSLSLFEEVRKSGVKVSCINPDLTDTNFFDDLKFEPSKKDQYYLKAQEISQAIKNIIQSESVITDLTIRPLYFEIKRK
jgi:short-subunit dehydrogenase